jgi:hypothetical protein
MRTALRFDGQVVQAPAALTCAPVADADAAMQLVRTAAERRATRDTRMNVDSSRSHSVFTLHMERRQGPLVVRARLHLVDLAGSEQVSKTGAEGMRP